MRCAACGAENSDQEKQCKHCGARLPRPSRRREIQSVPSSWTSKRLDDQAFRLAIWGLFPPAGLILGPLALILGMRAIRHARAAGEERLTPAMIATLIIGGGTMLASWCGLSLMVLGLISWTT
jgi:hypothetical protein